MSGERLTDYAANTTSQNGEDGMLAELLSRLDVSRGWCAELGAWDGKHLSNTWRLWHEEGWSAVLIEGDTERADALSTSTYERAGVHVIQAYARAATEASLDSLFARTTLPRHFEVLSIDIDGDDYHLWADLQDYQPLVVVVEHNVSFPPEVEFVQKARGYTGSSARALVNLAEKKGYQLVGLTQANLLFVDAQQAAKLGDLEADLETLFDRSWLPVVYSDFGGHHFVLRPGGWGYTAASRHGDPPVSSQLRAAVAVTRRQARQRVGEVKRQAALRAPALTEVVHAVRRRMT